jgi:hypothetical protein
MAALNVRRRKLLRWLIACGPSGLPLGPGVWVFSSKYSSISPADSSFGVLAAKGAFMRGR